MVDEMSNLERLKALDERLHDMWDATEELTGEIEGGSEMSDAYMTVDETLSRMIASVENGDIDAGEQHFDNVVNMVESSVEEIEAMIEAEVGKSVDEVISGDGGDNG